MGKSAISAAEKAGKILATDASSRSLRGAVWAELRTLRDGAVAAKGGRWMVKETANSKGGGKK